MVPIMLSICSKCPLLPSELAQTRGDNLPENLEAIVSGVASSEAQSLVMSSHLRHLRQSSKGLREKRRSSWNLSRLCLRKTQRYK